ncbi:hypothetical protein CSUB01_10813 [Colletotrichum sublineola]|uniref:PD-(D/E)XK nuclease-like domain-containing protein n=1 Tax=Colletotrichum sublineola TaxID=1173701 RepID=A0A066X6W5_COLSU|nr:hypothetical protein CSUB01_10813 [Colletotrichum sublineola]
MTTEPASQVLACNDKPIRFYARICSWLESLDHPVIDHRDVSAVTPPDTDAESVPDCRYLFHTHIETWFYAKDEDREKLGCAPPVAKVLALLRDARICSDEGYCEASWNIVVHRELLQLAVLRYAPGPEGKVSFTPWRPIGLSIEAKRSSVGLGNAEPQLSVWLTARWQTLERRANRTESPQPLPNFLPRVIVKGHDCLDRDILLASAPAIVYLSQGRQLYLVYPSRRSVSHKSKPAVATPQGCSLEGKREGRVGSLSHRRASRGEAVLLNEVEAAAIRPIVSFLGRLRRLPVHADLDTTGWRDPLNHHYFSFQSPQTYTSALIYGFVSKASSRALASNIHYLVPRSLHNAKGVTERIAREHPKLKELRFRFGVHQPDEVLLAASFLPRRQSMRSLLVSEVVTENGEGGHDVDHVGSHKGLDRAAGAFTDFALLENQDAEPI